MRHSFKLGRWKGGRPMKLYDTAVKVEMTFRTLWRGIFQVYPRIYIQQSSSKSENSQSPSKTFHCLQVNVFTHFSLLKNCLSINIILSIRGQGHDIKWTGKFWWNFNDNACLTFSSACLPTFLYSFSVSLFFVMYYLI